MKPQTAAVVVSIAIAAATVIFAAGGTKAKVIDTASAAADQARNINDHERRISMLEQGHHDMRIDITDIKTDVKEILRRMPR